ACEVLDEHVMWATDPTGRVDTSIVVQRALLRLPVEQRAAVVVVDMQGYSVAEAARLLGVAEGTVKSRCSRARTKLAESLTCFATGSCDPSPSDNLDRTGTDTIGGSDDEQRRQPQPGFRPRPCRPHPGRTRRGPSRVGPPGT
ncbi:hypothetical protein C6A85_97495, partial [Mycobacterium sp. ITM-2017-0098]